MNFGLKTYLAEETKRYNIVLVKKKLHLNERDGGNKHEWSLLPSNAIATLWPGDVLVGFSSKGGHFKWATVLKESGEARYSDAGSTADFKPSEYEELLKVKALKGLA
jgi:hypothetical protein